jgi:exonuclease III
MLYQPGGTMTMVTDKYTGQVKEMGHNIDLGRYSYIKMIRKHGRLIIMVTIYNVCNQQGNHGSNHMAHTQQLSLLLQQGRSAHPRKAFLDDFDHQVTDWIATGHELIIAGDINEELGNDISRFSRISAKHHLIEFIQHKHDIEGEPPTYARGSKHLDYIFVTIGLETSVRCCGILPYSDILNSDHHCLYMDFDTCNIIWRQSSHLIPITSTDSSLLSCNNI